MRVLGIDFGESRIGLAVSDPTGTLARPLRTISPRGSLAERASAVGAEVSKMLMESGESDLGAVVVGFPRSLSGAEQQQTERVLAFVDALRASIPLPVLLQDERLSSVEAEQRLAICESDWRKRKTRLDAASAAVILQDFLDQKIRDNDQKPGKTVGGC